MKRPIFRSNLGGLSECLIFPCLLSKSNVEKIVLNVSRQTLAKLFSFHETGPRIVKNNIGLNKLQTVQNVLVYFNIIFSLIYITVSISRRKTEVVNV